MALLAEAGVKEGYAAPDLCFPKEYPPKFINLPRKCEFTFPFR